MASSFRLNLIFLGLAVPFMAFAQEKHKPQSPILTKEPGLALTAKDALLRALGESHAIKKSVDDHSAAAAQVRQKQSSFLPELKAEVSAGTTRGYEPTNPLEPDENLLEKDRNLYNGKLILTQNLFSGFSTINGLAAAQAAKEVADLKLMQQKSAIIEETFSLYFGIQLMREQIAVEAEVQALRENQRNQTRSRWQQGRATKLDFLQAEYAFKSQGPKIQKLQVNLQNQKIRLIRLLGYEVNQSLTLSDALATAYQSVSKITLPPLPKAYENLLKGNRDIRIAQADVSRVDLEASKNGSKHLPTLDLVITAELDSQLREKINSEENRKYAAMLKMTVPIFSGLDSFSTIQERRAIKSAYSETAILARENSLTTLSENYAQWDLNKATIEAESANVELSKEATKNSQALYAAGRTTLSEVLDSYSRQLDAKKNYLQGMYDQIILAIKIRHLMGGEFEGITK